MIPALFDGTRVSKADARVAAYGDVDELNAWLGWSRAAARRTTSRRSSSGFSAICSPSARGWPIPRIASPAASRRPPSPPTTSPGSRAGSTARSGAAAASPVHPRRRRAGRRRAARGADDLPPGRTGDGRSSATTRSRSSCCTTSTACRICCSRWPRASIIGPASRKSSGERSAAATSPRPAACLRRLRASWRGRTTRTFRWPRCLLPRRMRPAIAAIYAFARRADDFADEPGDRRRAPRACSTTGIAGSTRPPPAAVHAGEPPTT